MTFVGNPRSVVTRTYNFHRKRQNALPLAVSQPGSCSMRKQKLLRHFLFLYRQMTNRWTRFYMNMNSNQKVDYFFTGLWQNFKYWIHTPVHKVTILQCRTVIFFRNDDYGNKRWIKEIKIILKEVIWSIAFYLKTKLIKIIHFLQCLVLGEVTNICYTIYHVNHDCMKITSIFRR